MPGMLAIGKEEDEAALSLISPVAESGKDNGRRGRGRSASLSLSLSLSPTSINIHEDWGDWNVGERESPEKR